MKELLNFIAFIIMFTLFYLLITGVNIHTADETNVNMDHRVKDNVYVLPDSIKGIVEGGYIFTKKHKNPTTKVRTDEIFLQFYTIVYTDKNGVIQRLKQVKPEILVKR